MGKVLIEKLLVSCPTIGNLYLLIREKKGKTFKERFDTLFKDDVSTIIPTPCSIIRVMFYVRCNIYFQVFVRLHKLVPNFRTKVIAISGDCSTERLGLSADDYDFLASKVSVIFHGAATVRFDETLKHAVNINIRGVREMLNFSKQCKSLKVIKWHSNCHCEGEF